MGEEVWKTIPGYEGLYEISSHGKVKSVPHTRTIIRNGKPIQQAWSGRMMTTGASTGRYPKVNLSNNGKVTTHHIHSLVASTFLGQRPPELQTCHGDGKSDNPNLSNLRYDTPSGNCADRVTHGTALIGETHPRAKLTEDKVRAIREDLKTMMQKDVSEKHGVPNATVGAISRRRTWKHVE